MRGFSQLYNIPRNQLLHCYPLNSQLQFIRGPCASSNLWLGSVVVQRRQKSLSITCTTHIIGDKVSDYTSLVVVEDDTLYHQLQRHRILQGKKEIIPLQKNNLMENQKLLRLEYYPFYLLYQDKCVTQWHRQTASWFHA